MIFFLLQLFPTGKRLSLRRKVTVCDRCLLSTLIVAPFDTKSVATPPSIFSADNLWFRISSAAVAWLEWRLIFDPCMPPFVTNRFFLRVLLWRRDEDFRSLKNAVAILANDTCRFDAPAGGSPLPPLFLYEEKKNQVHQLWLTISVNK